MTSSARQQANVLVELLRRERGASKRDAKDVVAELAPEPAPVRTVVTPVPAPPIVSFAPTHSAGRLADLSHANARPQAGTCTGTRS